jgi:8-oxo-dGTP pyrophosphatase MutT (NUDIX family)
MVQTIRIAAALIENAEGAVFLVRKQGTRFFMQPGGKIDHGETPLDALQRELVEELRLSLDPSEALYLGQFRALAANEPDHIVEAELFRVCVDHPISISAEIAEGVWVDPNAPALMLAPLTRDYVLPLARRTQAA